MKAPAHIKMAACSCNCSYTVSHPPTTIHTHVTQIMDEKTYLLSESTDLELSQKHSKKKGWRRYWSYDCLPCIPARYSLALVSCLGFVNVYALRVNLSVAIVQMVNSTTTTLGNQSGTAEVGHVLRL